MDINFCLYTSREPSFPDPIRLDVYCFDDEGGSDSGEHSGDRSDGEASIAATEQFEYNEDGDEAAEGGDGGGGGGGGGGEGQQQGRVKKTRVAAYTLLDVPPAGSRVENNDTAEQQALLVAHLVFLMRQRWAQQTGAPALSATPLALSAARGAGVGDHTDIAEKRARTEVPDCDDFERPRQANKTQAHKTQATVARQRRAEREREAKMAGMNEPERARYLKGLRQAAATRERQRARAKAAAAGVAVWNLPRPGGGGAWVAASWLKPQ